MHAYEYTRRYNPLKYSILVRYQSILITLNWTKEKKTRNHSKWYRKAKNRVTVDIKTEVCMVTST